MESINRLRPPQEIQLQSELSRLIAEKQQEISTGKRLEKPSDDPASWLQISEISKQQANIASWVRNIDRGQSISGQAEEVISEISNQLSRANELLIQANSNTNSPETRELIAVEMEALETSITDLINSRNGFGEELFTNGQPRQIPIDKGIQISVAPAKDEFSSLSPVLLNAANAIRTGDDADRSSALDALQTEITTTANLLGSQGILSNQLDQAKSLHQDRQLDLTIVRSSLEDADITQSIASMQRLLVNLQAAQATYAQIEQSTLFDVLR